MYVSSMGLEFREMGFKKHLQDGGARVSTPI